jgi:hypothetical protein
MAVLLTSVVRKRHPAVTTAPHSAQAKTTKQPPQPEVAIIVA